MTINDDERDILSYIKHNPVAVLGTVGQDNVPHGAAIYLCAITAKQVYFATKTETQKYQDILTNSQVSVTIVNPADSSSLQAHGRAQVVENPRMLDLIFEKLKATHSHTVDRLPPLAKLHAGPYQLIGVDLSYVRLAEFQGKTVGGKDIFKEV